MPTHSTTDDAKAAKNRRLADALRANLRRRKAAARPGVDPSAREPASSNGHDRGRDDGLDKG